MAAATTTRRSAERTEAVELDRRRSAGQQVRLLWVPERNEIYVEQRSLSDGRRTFRSCPPEKALDAFHHPELYPPVEEPPRFVVSRGEIADDER
jgi:hypothetical protein